MGPSRDFNRERRFIRSRYADRIIAAVRKSLLRHLTNFDTIEVLGVRDDGAVVFAVKGNDIQYTDFIIRFGE